MRFLVVVELITSIEAHGTLLTSVLLHGMSPQVFVELGLIVEGLVTIFTFVGLVEMSGKDVRLVVPDRDHSITVRTFLGHEVFVNMS